MRNHIIALLFWVAAIGLSLWAYPQLPDQVATHWGPSGEANGYSSRGFAVLFGPGMMLLMYVMLRVLPKLDPKRNNYPRFQSSLDVVILATLLLLLIVHGVVVFNGLGYDVPVSMVVPLVIGGLYVVMGNVMPRFKHNYFVGIRTPWTLANERVWTRTHMVGGKVFVIGGLLVMASALIPNNVMVPVMVTLLVAIPLSILLLSYYYYKHP